MMAFILFVSYVLVSGHMQRKFNRTLVAQYCEAITLCADTMEHCADVIDKLCDDVGSDDTSVRAAAKARDAAEEVRFTFTPLPKRGNVIPMQQR